jgi:thioesterase domain-containing protein
LAREHLWPEVQTEWGDVTKTAVTVHVAEGNHFDMVKSPRDEELARSIRAAFDARGARR